VEGARSSQSSLQASVDKLEQELAATAAKNDNVEGEAAECVTLLEEQLELTVKTKGQEIVDLRLQLDVLHKELQQAQKVRARLNVVLKFTSILGPNRTELA